MTTPPLAPPGTPVAPPGLPVPGLLYDPGNPLLATGVPSSLSTGKLPTPAGEIGAVTLRTTTTTVSVTLTKADLALWIADLQKLHDSLSASGLQVASGPARLIPGR